ncbi:MAG: NUDIX hydrolase [Eubacteriales bacterium]
MEFCKIEKIKDGRYLKNYELTYLNKAGKEKKYEIVSRKELRKTEDLGAKSSGVSIVIRREGELLLLREFRMGINRKVFNLVAGMIEEDETIEDCVRRELYEETGLELVKITSVLPASFAAVAISDIKTQIVFAEARGIMVDYHTSDNEQIEAQFYTKEEVRILLETEEFSSRAQIVAHFFANEW